MHLSSKPYTSLLSVLANTIRIKTLSITVAVILLGQGLAWYDLHTLAKDSAISPQPSLDYFLASIIILCSLLLQIAVNLANDYFDGLSGIDTQDRVGPKRAMQIGLISPRMMAYCILLITFFACVLGLYLIYRGGWIYFMLGLFSLYGVYAYSGGKKPLASLGLGELAVFIYFGYLAVIASYVLQTEYFNSALLFPATQIGLLISAVMLINNIRDIETDDQKGKYTLAVRIGNSNAKSLYYCLILIPFLLIPFDHYQPYLNYILLPFAMYLCRKMKLSKGSDNNILLGKASLLVLLWSIFYLGALVKNTV